MFPSIYRAVLVGKRFCVQKAVTIYFFLFLGVDIWKSHSSENETQVDFLVSPSQNYGVKEYLISNGIPFKVSLTTFFK